MSANKEQAKSLAKAGPGIGAQLKNNKQDFQSMKFPIFGLVRYRDKIVISGGAGAKNVGIQDKIVRNEILKHRWCSRKVCHFRSSFLRRNLTIMCSIWSSMNL
jgi:hypothetical protein